MQFITVTAGSLFEDYENDFKNVLNGLTIIFNDPNAHNEILGIDMGSAVTAGLEFAAAVVNCLTFGLPPSDSPEPPETKPYSSAPPATAHQDTYRWSNVTSLPVGTRIKVCDVVSEVNKRNGAYFINFGGSYPNNVAFIRSRDGSKVPKPGQKSCHVGSLERSSGGKYYTLQD